MIERKIFSRRRMLQGAGAVVALPLLDSMRPAFARSERAGAAPRRFVAIETAQGILPQFFFPDKAGRDYPATPYLEILKDFREDLTVFSGLSHPQVDGGHQAEKAFLTGAPHPGRSGFRSTISLDQFMAERIGHETRFASLTLKVAGGPRTISYTRSGAMIPGEKSPAALYRRLFVQGKPGEVDAQIGRLREGRSIMDVVADRARSLRRRVGAGDRDRLDQYFTSVREVERRLLRAEEWERRPKPKVNVPPPKDIRSRNDLVGQTRLMYDLIRLALQTDSTRLVTLFINPAGSVPTVDGVSTETHALTHHGNKPEKIAELRRIEEAQFKVLARLLQDLKGAQEEGGTLLDRTMVLYGTCMGSANAHSNVNLPVLLAGGGFRHGRHLAFDGKKNAPLANVFVSILQRLGIEADAFSSSTGRMVLEPA